MNRICRLDVIIKHLINGVKSSLIKQTLKTKTLPFIMTAALTVALVVPTTIFAQQAPESVTICHATASTENPYVQQTPNIQNDGSLVGGHLDHTGPIYPAQNWGDIIPSYQSGEFSYPGMNWTDEGQAIWNNNCNIPQQDQQPASDPEPEVVTIIAHKIICDSETDLPNWGPGGSDITSTTAQDFIIDHPTCHFAENWEFQWGPQEAYDPGDTMTGPADAPWETMPATDVNGMTTVSLTSEDIGDSNNLWFREVLQEGYIPFTFDSNGDTNTDDVSAEMYCHIDVLNYDNYDRIDGIQLGQTYNCIGLNAAVQQVPEECDFDDQTGWYGRYYDYDATHPDMDLPQNEWPDAGHGDPLGGWDTDWYDSQYLIQTQVDSDLNFGGNFFPLDSIGEDPADSGHNYHFGVHWSGKITVPADGSYGYSATSDDDLWLYVDGVLADDNAGIHPSSSITGSLALTTGTHIVDIFFAERHTVQSEMSFAFTGEVQPEVTPYNANCPSSDPAFVLEKAGVYDPETGQISYTIDWSIAGEGTLHDVTITDTIPSDTTYISSDPAGSTAGDTVTWSLGDKTAPDSGTITLVVQIDSYEVWADAQSDFDQGQRKNGTDVLVERSDPNKALGEAENDDTLNFVSLGFGGSLVLHFNNYILDGTGDDIAVTETSFGSPSDSNYPEKVEVFASQDGTTWVSLGVGTQDEEFDLDGSGLVWAKHLKLVDVSDSSDSHFPADADGYDIDGVKALHSAPAECSISNSANISGLTDSQQIITANGQTTTIVNELACLPQEEPGDDTHTLISGMKFNDHDGDGSKDETDEGLADWRIYASSQVGEFEVDSYGDVTGTPIDSIILDNGVEYLVRVSGTFEAGDAITADAKYSVRLPNLVWTDLVQNYESYGPTLLDLQLDGVSPDWGTYNPTHTYWYTITGTGAAVSFQIYDIFASNNVGTLDVTLYQVIDSTLTDTSGNYSFDLVNIPGSIVLSEQTQTGWIQTAPADGYYLVEGGDNSYLDRNFGNHQINIEEEDGGDNNEGDGSLTSSGGSGSRRGGNEGVLGEQSDPSSSNEAVGGEQTLPVTGQPIAGLILTILISVSLLGWRKVTS